MHPVFVPGTNNPAGGPAYKQGGREGVYRVVWLPRYHGGYTGEGSGHTRRVPREAQEASFGIRQA